MKRKRAMLTAGVQVLVILSLCFAGCSSKEKTKKRVVGVWKEVGGDDVICFKKDGSFSLHSEDNPNFCFFGNYKFIEKKKIKLEFEGLGKLFIGSLTGGFSSENKLWIIDPISGEKDYFQKIGRAEDIQKFSKTERESRFAVTTSYSRYRPRKALPQVRFVDGGYQIGNFLVVFNSVERESGITTFIFLASKRSLRRENSLYYSRQRYPIVEVTVTDDHENKYSGNLVLRRAYTQEGYPVDVFPVGFFFPVKVAIRMPQIAPIKTIKVGDSQPVELTKLKAVKEVPLEFLPRDYILEFNQQFSFGKYCFIRVERIVSYYSNWAVILNISNKDYKPISLSLGYGIQYTDGTFDLPSGSQITVSGLSEQEEKLILRLSQKTKTPKALLIWIQEPGFQKERIFKILPLSEEDFPLTVGQGLEKEHQEVFCKVYKECEGALTLGNPKGIVKEVKDEKFLKNVSGVLVQEFEKGIILWDKKNESNPVALYGKILSIFKEKADLLGMPIRGPAKYNSAYYRTTRTCAFFQKGAIVYDEENDSEVIIKGSFYRKWLERNSMRGELGFPKEMEKQIFSGVKNSKSTGYMQMFEGGALYLIKDEQEKKVIEIEGNAFLAYHKEGGAEGWLGFPLSEIYKSFTGKALQIDFEGGLLVTKDGRTWQALSYPAGNIVFVSDRDGDPEIYLMDSKGRNLRKITENECSDLDPVISPDGKWIAYSSNLKGNFDIFLKSIDGSKWIRVTQQDTDERYPLWFPNSRLRMIYVMRHRNGKTVLVEGKLKENEKQEFVAFHGTIIPFSLGEKTVSNIITPNFSSDGETLVMVWKVGRRKELCIMDYREIKKILARQRRGESKFEKVMRIIGTIAGCAEVIGEAIPKSETWLPYVSRSRAIAEYFGNRERGEKTPVLQEGRYAVSGIENVRCAPGKDLLALTARSGYFQQEKIYLAFSEDGKWLQYFLTSGKDACFSPDGKWIVFSRDGDICVIDLSGTYGKILTKKTERKNWSPFWGKSFSKNKG